MARPSTLTEKKQKIICEAIAKGHTKEMAAKMAGIGVRTLYDWISRGKKQKHGRYSQFLQALKEAEYEAEDFLLQKVVKAADMHWAAAMTILERRWPQKWAKREYVEAKQEISFPLPREVSVDEAQEAKEIIKAITGRNGKNGSGVLQTSRLGKSE